MHGTQVFPCGPDTESNHVPKCMQVLHDALVIMNKLVQTN